ncbi:hypothetical protein JYT44_00640 [Caldithrix abyssi]|nr:hypothetical protein [Caldithrix abyssi]
MKKLILGYLPSDYSSETHIIMGPWVFLNNQNLLFQCEPFESDPYKNAIELKKDADLAVHFVEHLVIQTAKRLNKINNADYSVEFWRILIIPWLSTLVQITLERYRRIQKVLDKYSKESLEVELLESSYNWNFENTHEFLNNGVLDVLFNEWLLSRIIEKQAIPSLHIVYKTNNSANKAKNNSNAYTQLRRIYKEVNQKLMKLFPSASVYGISLVEAPLWEVMLKFKRVKKTVYNYTERSSKVKPNLCEIKEIVNWKLLIEATTPQFFNNIPKNIKKPKPRFLLIGPDALYYNEKNKLGIAIQKEVGSIIIVTQHGSGYGTLKVLPYKWSLEYGHDVFITWGWRNQSSYKCNTIPLPSPYLKKKIVIKNDNILLVGHHSSLISYRIPSIPQPGDQIDIIRQLGIFIKLLNSELRAKLVYRPYPMDSASLNAKKYIKLIDPDINILDRSINKEIYRARLLVIDHPGTVLHQRIAANLPTICFWSENKWGLSEQAIPYFDALRDVGILFNNTNKAARKVNDIWDDIDSWWFEGKIQKARADWAWQYARKSKNWRGKWIRTISELKS